jgi:type IV fimbrial biogenesis protein FimT
LKPAPRPLRGFTVIELVVTLVVTALLTNMVINSMATWMNSARIRTAADEIQSGLRQAQAEAVKQNRPVAFVLTTSKAWGTTMPAAAASGSYWYTATVPWLTYTAAGVNNAQTLVAAGEISPDMSQVTITGASSICFNPYGRVSGNYTIPTGAVTSSGAAATVSCGVASTTYVVTASNGDTTHNLDVTVNSGGQIRMCNPAKTLSTSNPDGCPSTLP